MDSARRVELLRSLAAFSALPEERLRVLAPLLQPLSVSDTSAFVREGERGDGMYCIVSGRVRIAKSLAEGGQRAQKFDAACGIHATWRTKTAA